MSWFTMRRQEFIAAHFRQSEVRAELRRVLELQDLQRPFADSTRFLRCDARNEQTVCPLIRADAVRPAGDDERRLVRGRHQQRPAPGVDTEK